MINFKVCKELGKWKALVHEGKKITLVGCINKVRSSEEDFQFVDKKGVDDTSNFILSALKTRETFINCDDLNRVIRNGGFTEYIKKLEVQNVKR